MEMLEVFKGLGGRVQLPMLLAQESPDGEVRVFFANDSANVLLQYADDAWPQKSVRELFPVESTKQLQDWVNEPSCWRNVEATRGDGSKVPVGLSVTAVRDSDESCFVLFLRDRTESVRYEAELKASVDAAQSAKALAERSRQEADEARKSAEDSLFVQKKLSVQTDLLRYIWKGTLGLIVMLAVLVVFGWVTGKYEKDSLAMFERILLVLTGMLSTAMASMFDSRRAGTDEPTKKQ